MDGFLGDIFAYTFDFPSKFYDNFSPVCSYKDLSVGSVHTTVSGNTEPALKLTSPSIRCTFDDVVIDMVTSLYKKLKPDKSNVTV